MTAAGFAPGLRRTAQVYRRRAAEVRANATPKSRALAETIAGRWETMAAEMDAQADDIEAANRTEPPMLSYVSKQGDAP